jgi:hypothetical protein
VRRRLRGVEPPAQEQGGLGTRDAAVGVDLVKQDQLRLFANPGPHPEEPAEPRISHPLIEHLGRGEENVRRGAEDLLAGQDNFVRLSADRALRLGAREPLRPSLSILVQPDEGPATAGARAAQERADVAPGHALPAGRRPAGLERGRVPRCCAEQGRYPYLAVARCGQHRIEAARLSIGLRELVLEQLIARVESEAPRPGLVAQAAGQVDKRGEVERERLATPRSRADDRTRWTCAGLQPTEDPLTGPHLEVGQFPSGGQGVDGGALQRCERGRGAQAVGDRVWTQVPTRVATWPGQEAGVGHQGRGQPATAGR